ncbi:hypothetical protein B0H19DRAFT_184163 [Mycena capillaripes]|nr:hypothetical protein B0H19DRAFT_184163 [Mycena capillaripes]
MSWQRMRSEPHYLQICSNILRLYYFCSPCFYQIYPSFALVVSSAGAKCRCGVANSRQLAGLQKKNHAKDTYGTSTVQKLVYERPISGGIEQPSRLSDTNNSASGLS